MSESLDALLFVMSLALALVVVHRPLGDLLHWIEPPRVQWRLGFPICRFSDGVVVR